MARAAPTTDPQALQVRAGTPSPPDPEDDGLPKGDAKDLIPWTDDDFANEDYKSALDYDPDQDGDLDKSKRSIDLSLVRRDGPKKETTEWLRSVGVDGTEVRQGFLNSINKKFIGLTGTLGKDNQLGMLETTTEFVVPKPKPKIFKSWQADHVQDLGIYVTIASQGAPAGIAAKDWQTIQDAILGEEDENVTEPSENTKTLGRMLNDPNNIRGITYPMNQLKNSIMGFAYSSQTTKASWKNWNRSNVWGLYRYMKHTKPQFDEVTRKATVAIKGFIKDEDSGSEIAEHYTAEVNRIYNKAITELERVLEDPPPDNNKDSIFKTEDCKNTKESPDSPSAGGSGTPTTRAAPTLVPSATVAPANPPARASCIANPTTPVKDSHEDELQKAAAFFCKNYASSTVTTSHVNIAQTVISGILMEGRQTVDVARLYTGTDNEDDVYDIRVTSVDGCTPAGGYNLGTPVADSQCPDLLHSAWKQCNNQGRGGSIVAGCLVYSISTKY